MATAKGNLIAFETALDQREIRYREQEGSKVPSLRIGYTLENINHLDVFFWFDEDGTTMHYATGVIAHAPENKTTLVQGTGWCSTLVQGTGWCTKVVPVSCVY